MPAKEEFAQWSCVMAEREMAEQGVGSTTGEKFVNETLRFYADIFPMPQERKRRGEGVCYELKDRRKGSDRESNEGDFLIFYRPVKLHI